MHPCGCPGCPEGEGVHPVAPVTAVADNLQLGETACDCCEGESSSSKQHDQHRRPARRFVYRPTKSPQLAVLPSRLLGEHHAVFFVVSARSTLIRGEICSSLRRFAPSSAGGHD